ncbi:hypothetical protein EDF56_102233 [Novosphingobium sp. PhB165]|nr:hypothetical protein EDF56_102233 [Novosphingobium sp. PhB165]
MGPKTNFQPARKSGVAAIGVKLFRAILESVEARAQAVGGAPSRRVSPSAEQGAGKLDGLSTH